MDHHGRPGADPGGGRSSLIVLAACAALLGGGWFWLEGGGDSDDAVVAPAAVAPGPADSGDGAAMDAVADAAAAMDGAGGPPMAPASSSGAGPDAPAAVPGAGTPATALFGGLGGTMAGAAPLSREWLVGRWATEGGSCDAASAITLHADGGASGGNMSGEWSVADGELLLVWRRGTDSGAAQTSRSRLEPAGNDRFRTNGAVLVRCR